MALKRRETILAAVTGTLLLVLGLAFFLSDTETRSTDALRKSRDLARQRVNDFSAQARRAAPAKAKMDELAQRALPATPDARTNYQNWLGRLVEKVGFRNPNVISRSATERRGAGNRPLYTEYVFTVNSRGSLAQLVDFLFDFYSAGHLQQIEYLNVSPVEGGGPNDLQFDIRINAIAMPGVKRTELTALPGEQLAHKTAAYYQDAITRRRMEANRFQDATGLFAGYAPPPAKNEHRDEGPKTPPAFDHSKFAKITAIIEVGGKPEAWILVQTTGEKFQLGEGAKFKVGPAEGQILHIGENAVDLIFAGKQLRVPNGASLHDGQELAGVETLP